MLNSDNIQILFSSSPNNPFARFYSNDQTPNNSNQNQENPPQVLSSNFPAVIDEHQFPLSQILSPSQATIHGDVVDDQENIHRSINQMETSCQVKPTKRRVPAPSSSRRKTRKKSSTHSKICTAQGMRDRRMRLSLPIARKVFDLQDLLGFDKASKTIEWLFSNSQDAIKELQRKHLSQGKKGSYCSSEENIEGKFMPDEFEVKSAKDVEQNPNNKDITKSRKSLFNCNHAKLCRERARARARERTKEKMKIKGIEQWCESSSPSKDNDLLKQHFGHFFPFEDHSSSYTTQYAGISHEKDYSNSTGYMRLLGNCNNSVNTATVGLVTSNSVSECYLPSRKFPFLLQ